MSSIKKNFAYNIVLALSQVLFPIVTFPYVTRILGPEGLGLVSFVDSYAGYFILLAALGIPLYGVREIAKATTPAELSQTFSEIFSIHLVLTLVCIVFYALTLLLYGNISVTYPLFIWGAVMIFSCIFIGEWYFQGTGKFKFIAIRTMLIRLISIIFLFCFVTEKSDELNYFLIIVVAVIINAFVNFYYIRKEIAIRFLFSREILLKHFRPMFYLFFSRAAVTVFLFMDIILLGFLSSADRVGIYSTGLKISKIPILVVSSLGVVLIPRLTASFHTGDHTYFTEMIRKSVKFVISVSIPILFFFFTTSSEIIYLFAGSQYDDAHTVVKILSPVILIIGLSSIFSMQILMPMGKDREVMIAVFAASAVCLILNFTLIPILAEVGAAITNLFVELVLGAITFFFAAKYMKGIIDWRFLFINILFGVPSILFVYAIRYFGFNEYVILILSGMLFCIYFVIVHYYILKNELLTTVLATLKQRLYR